MKILKTLAILFLATKSYGQLTVNLGVDTTSLINKEVVSFYYKYVEDYKENNTVKFQEYFNAEEIVNLKIPDKTAIGLIGDRTNYVMGTPTVLNIDSKDNPICLKVMFADVNEQNQISVNFIANYFVEKTPNGLKFKVHQNIATKSWNKTKVRNVTFIYPNYHAFNSIKADGLIRKIKKLEDDWGFDPINITYFFANTTKEIEAVKGYDYNYLMGGSDLPTGLQYQKEKSIFASWKGEDYFHEFVHTYINNKYPKNVLKEGIATFYGGSQGLTYYEGLQNVYDFIKSKPSLDISNPSDFYYLDKTTIPTYHIQALLCHLINERDGIEGLKRLMSYTSINDLFEKEFGVYKEEKNSFLRQKIESLVAKK